MITAAIAEDEPLDQRLSFEPQPMTPALARLFARAELPFTHLEVTSASSRQSARRPHGRRKGNVVRL